MQAFFYQVTGNLVVQKLSQSSSAATAATLLTAGCGLTNLGAAVAAVTGALTEVFLG